MEARAEVSAFAEPETPAITTPVTMVAWPRPPLKWPTRLFAQLTRMSVMPDFSIRVPASMKKGTAMREKESIPVKSFCGMIIPVSEGSKKRVMTAEMTMP